MKIKIPNPNPEKFRTEKKSAKISEISGISGENKTIFPVDRADWRRKKLR